MSLPESRTAKGNDFNCPDCGFWHVTGTPCPVPPNLRENRIEALRAASRVVAQWGTTDMPPGMKLKEATLHLADEFARWLEEGE